MGRPLPLHPLLFGAWFVLALYASNLGEAVFGDVLPVLVAAVAGTALLFGVAAAFLTLTGRRDLRSAALIASGWSVVLFGYGHVAEAVEPFEVRSIVLQAIAAAVALVAIVVERLLRGHIVTATRALNLVSGLLVAASLVSIIPHEVDRLTRRPVVARAVPVAGEPLPGPRRDVWYVIFDRYGNPRELESFWGIETDIDDWLTERGFYVAADSHANYQRTQLSLASSLNLEYLDDVAARMGPDSDDEAPIYELIRNHALGRFLQAQGYDYVHVGSRWQPTDINRYADENPRQEALSDFAQGFLDTTILPAAARRLGLTRGQLSRERYWNFTQWQFRTLHELVDRAGPKLVFAHFLVPHPPYVFAADGSFVAENHPPERQPAAFAEQLKWTDTQIKSLVGALLALPEERRPIVVIQADEGPYPDRYNLHASSFDWSTGTPEELRLKFGILNAYYLPGVEAAELLYPTITPVNSFRLILGRYFGADLPRYADRVFTSRARSRPYDLTDVTSRLARP